MRFDEENKYTEGEKFKVTVEWMRDRYEKANRELFNGVLGQCYFEAEHTRPSNLGNFRMNVDEGDVAYMKSDRRMFKRHSDYYDKDGVYHGKIYINRENFFTYCKPTIRMNTMYSGTENSLYNTLVHEMCHYYTYMDGLVPAKAHGREFRNIAMVVSNRSNGLFTIQRLASAEEMEGYQLDDGIKVRKRKHNTPHYYLEFLNDGSDKVRLSNLNATGLKTMLTYMKRDSTVIELKNEEIANRLYDDGYRQQSRNYSFWTLYRGEEIVTEILMDNDNYSVVWQGK